MLTTYRTRIRVVGKRWDRIVFSEETYFVINLRYDELTVFCLTR